MAKLATDASYRKFLVNNSMEQSPIAGKIRAMSMKVECCYESMFVYDL